MGNLCSLTELYLHKNQLLGGIPPSLGKIYKLENLFFHDNNLIGSIPTSMWNLSSLSILSMSHNNLSGLLPINAGQALPFLAELYLSYNQFHGPIPTSLSNASRLELLLLSNNMFSGTIPSNLGSLQHLQKLTLFKNQLEVREPTGWNFLTSLTNCTDLQFLQLDDNNLHGVLPYSFANLSTKLEVLTMSDNKISGNIPSEIENLASLTVLDLSHNMLKGSVPSSIGMLQNLHILDLVSNSISGEIPSTLGNLTQLLYLRLQVNELNGKIPASLGNCQSLNWLLLYSNKLIGSIPKEILNISTLSRGLSLASNSLIGLLPAEVGNLKNLVSFDVSMNKLTGEIPKSLGASQELEQLYLHGNLFYGSIPSSLSALRGIQELDVSQNNLSGRVPDFLQDFHFLYYLNLSFNNFQGEMPRHGVFDNASAVSVLGNNKLCGGNPTMQLPACLSPKRNHKSHTLIVVMVIFMSSLFLFVLCSFLIVHCWIQKSRRQLLCSTIQEQNVIISYSELARATDGFSIDNIIGTGSFATVYKGILGRDSIQVVAVKVLKLQLGGASQSFMSECEAMRNIRHRNLVKIITVCSSIDIRGNDFKAVVLDFMANGSLDDWLHPKESEQCEPKRLNLKQRLNIAIDVSSALDYLHHHCETPIVHCDLKPSNILLDGDMTAHVGDFGLAKFIKKTTSKASKHTSSSIGLKGTIGYIAPEYGMGNRVSIHGDLYSYGILLLEMSTAKRPTDDMFKEGRSLRKFVELTCPERIMDIMDAQLLLEEDGETSGDAQNMNGTRTKACVASVLRVGILCSNEVPAERMDMGDVIRDLHKIRDVFSQNKTSRKK